jgi:methyl-accepting chemotaxis protein
LGIAGYVGYQIIADEAEKSAKREMRTLAESAGQSLNVFMNDRVSDTLVWADLRPIKEAIDVAEVREDASQMLRETVKLYGAYECIFLLDAKGNCIASSAPALVGIDFSGNDAFKGAKDGKLFVTDFQGHRWWNARPDFRQWTLGSPPVSGRKRSSILAYLKWSPVER